MNRLNTDGKNTRQATGLDAGHDKRLLAYSLAAGASAMGMAGQAGATVIYSGVQDLAIGQVSGQELNLDGDAYNDILLKNYVFGGNYQGSYVNFYPGKTIGFIAGPSNLAYASALSAGDPINATTTATGFATTSLAYGNNPNSEFDSVAGAFIGLSFPIGGATDEFLHYGWVRVTIDNFNGTFVINDWAYNDVPGEEILAGDTGDVTVPGDTDGDGDVDNSDLQKAIANFTGPQTDPPTFTKTTADGDNNADGAVSNIDLQAAISNFTGPIAAAAVPEPGSLALLAIGAFGLGAYRGRRDPTA